METKCPRELPVAPFLKMNTVPWSGSVENSFALLSCSVVAMRTDEQPDRKTIRIHIKNSGIFLMLRISPDCFVKSELQLKATPKQTNGQ
jgi:hypothetical protein